MTKKQMWNRDVAIGCLTPLICLAAYLTYDFCSELSGNPIKAKKEILEMIPVGTPVKVAERKMQSMGFSCKYTQASTDDGLDLSKTLAPGSIRYFLGCRKERDYLPLLYAPVWMVYFYYDKSDKNQMITNVSLYVYSNDVP